MAWQFRDPTHYLSEFGHVRLWALGLLFFGLGDFLTTLAGLWITGVVEANPVLAPVLEHGAIVVIGGLKLLFLVGCFVLWKAIPRP